MRRKDRELAEKEVKHILENGMYGVLSTVGEDGYPYGVPVNYVFDRKKNVIYIHGTNEESKRFTNIEFSSKVCFTVVTVAENIPDKFATKYQSAIVSGNVHNPEDKKKALEDFIEKYSHDFKAEGMAYIESVMDKTRVYEIQIESMTRKERK